MVIQGCMCVVQQIVEPCVVPEGIDGVWIRCWIIFKSLGSAWVIETSFSEQRKLIAGGNWRSGLGRRTCVHNRFVVNIVRTKDAAMADPARTPTKRGAACIVKVDDRKLTEISDIVQDKVGSDLPGRFIDLLSVKTKDSSDARLLSRLSSRSSTCCQVHHDHGYN